MKKGHIIAIVAAVVIALLTAGGIIFYKYYVVPNYLEPVLNQVSEYLKEDEVVEELYNQALRLHDEGVMDDETYDNFVEAYKARMKNDKDTKKEEARALLEENEAREGQVTDETRSISAKYASSKVGVELVLTNDGESTGNSTRRYSSERTSDRVKVEDLVEAEKIIAEDELEEEEELNSGKKTEYESEEYESDDATEAPKSDEEKEDDTVKSAYAKLKANMTAGEYSDFIAIMSKLDIDLLKTYVSDKEGLKKYLKSRLSDDEYKRIVNLGYKYMNLFIAE